MTHKSHFVFELGCEELPSTSLLQLQEDLRSSIERELSSAGLFVEAISMIAAPRRLGFEITGLPEISAAQKFEKRGPALTSAYHAGKPTKALEGFCYGLGITADQVSILHTEKGAWVVYSGVEPGIATSEQIGKLCLNAIQSIPLSKSMRWGESRDEFPRPVRWILAMLNSKVIAFELFAKHSNQFTFGHRFHSPEQIVLKTASDYSSELSKNFVIGNFEIRKTIIWSKIQDAAAENRVTVEKNEALLNEICSLVEWPVGLAGKFDTSFLSVPEIVLVAAMRGHQKYFHTRTVSGELSNVFITIANIDSTNPSEVIAGNQRVIRARLADAKFFFESDQKSRLETKRPMLDSIMFHPELGSLGDKTQRIGDLISSVYTVVNVDPSHAARAVNLSRCDLVTEMVIEFDELQGQIGRIYAANDGENPVVADAIGGLYQPSGISDTVPHDLLGSLLGLCDRIDTLCGLFAIGQPPSGSKDPFGLRRAAIGILRLNEHLELRLDLVPLLHQSVKLQPTQVEEKTVQAIIQFIKDRERVRLTDIGLPYDTIAAVQALPGLANYQTALKAKSLQAFKGHPEFEKLVSANKRVSNMLEKINFVRDLEVSEKLFTGQSEYDLSNAVADLGPKIDRFVSYESFGESLNQLVQIHPYIHRFFENTMVNDPEPKIKANRLALLQQTRKLFMNVADLSQIQS